MHHAIPDRSISCPISSSSGTRPTSSSRDRPRTYLSSSFLPECILTRGVDVRLLVLARAPVRRLLALGDHLCDGAVELGAQREAQVMGEEDRPSPSVRPRSSPVGRAALTWISARSLVPRAVTTVNVIIRLSRIDSPGRVQMVPKGGRRSEAKYSSPSHVRASPSRRPRSSSRGPSYAARPWLVAAARAVVLGYAETATGLGHSVADGLGARPLPALHPAPGRRGGPRGRLRGGALPRHLAPAAARGPGAAGRRRAAGPRRRRVLHRQHRPATPSATCTRGYPRERYVVVALVDMRSADDRGRAGRLRRASSAPGSTWWRSAARHGTPARGRAGAGAGSW